MNNQIVNQKKVNYFSILKTRAILAIIFLIILFAYFFITAPENNQETTTIENPLKPIIQKNTNAQGLVNKNKIIQEGVAAFNSEYIEYILYALGAQELYTSPLGYGNPKLVIYIDGEIYSAEIVDQTVHISQNSITDPDFAMYISKEEIVNALLAQNMQQHLVDAYKSGDIRAEMLAGKAELVTKGYLNLYGEV